VHDKTIRRRRLVLLALVVGSLLLLTATFGNSSGGGIGSIQRGVSGLLTPVQDGATRALKPVRDGIGWVGDTFDAKSENARLKTELADARRVKGDANFFRLQADELRKLLDMNQSVGLDGMGLVPARVVGHTPTVLNQTIKINKGTSSDVHAGQPVVTGSGLVGTVSAVGSNFATVELLTDADFGAGVDVSGKKISGIVRPAAGAPRELRMQPADTTADIRTGDTLATSGTSDANFPSPFPPNVLVGRVTRVDDPQSDSVVVHVSPFVDVRNLDFVEVLTNSTAVGAS
jgi:rod shape-determining protein MreC